MVYSVACNGSSAEGAPLHAGWAGLSEPLERPLVAADLAAPG